MKRPDNQVFTPARNQKMMFLKKNKEELKQ
jgi:hypothetical protein